MHKLLAALVIAAVSSGCGVIYKVDVYQGSLLREENVEQLRTGLTRRQVVALLGTPAISDPFHQERWDYVSTVSKDGNEPEIHNLRLHFEGDVLARIEGAPLKVDDVALMREIMKYGNLPRADREKQQR